MRSLNVNKLSRFFSRMLRAFLNVQNVNINISQPSENVIFFSILLNFDLSICFAIVTVLYNYQKLNVFTFVLLQKFHSCLQKFKIQENLLISFHAMQSFIPAFLSIMFKLRLGV